jgi:hypothetical protein
MATDDNDSLPIELDLPADSDTSLPAWVATLIVAIGAVLPVPADVAFAVLRALLAPYAAGGVHRATFEALPTSARQAIRAAYDAKHAAITAAAMPTQRQPIPVVREASGPVPAVPAVLATATVPPRLAAVRNGSWARIRTGEHRGDWGARIPSGRGYVNAGDIVRLYRSNGNRSPSLHVLTDIVFQDATSTIAAVRDVTDAERASVLRGNTPANGVPVVDTSDERDVAGYGSGPTEADAQRDFPPSRDSGPITSSLTNIASEATSNAQPSAPRAERETVAPSSTSADGQSGTFQTNGTTHTPTGPSIFDRPRDQRTFTVGTPTNTAASVRRLIGERDFIAGAVAEGSMLQVSWTGGGETTCGKIDEALLAIGREGDSPERKSALAYAGDAVDSLRSRMYDTYRLPNNSLPDGIKAQWIVGRKLSGSTVNAGDAYGEALLVVSLKDDETLAFDGETGLASAVRTRYAAATAKQTLKSDTLTSWLARTLRTRHGGVKRGHVWYIPGGQADAARALINAISPLWGDHEIMPVTTGPDLMRSLTRGLMVEVQAIAKDFSNSTALAKAAARKSATKIASERHSATPETIEQEAELAESRATVSSVVAARILRELGTVAARVQGYETVLGADSVANAKAMIADLRRTLEPLTDDTSARASMLELD